MTITHFAVTTYCNSTMGDLSFCLHTHHLQLPLYDDSYHT